MAPGREDEFHRWVDELLAAAQDFPGYLGSGLLEPALGGSVWHVVCRFDSPERLAGWDNSAVRGRLLERGAEFMQTVTVRCLDGMEAWFASPGRPAAPPPRWKTFLMTATVILVRQTLLSMLLRPLTWVVMPRLSRWLWLYGTRQA